MAAFSTPFSCASSLIINQLLTPPGLGIVQDVGAPLVGYVVQMDDGCGGGWEEVAWGPMSLAEPLCVEVVDLLPGMLYKARIQAVNACGASKFSEPAKARTRCQRQSPPANSRQTPTPTPTPTTMPMPTQHHPTPTPARTANANAQQLSG